MHKECKQPTLSFGLICYRWVGEYPEYLMIQRKDSLSFMEFVRGKYNMENPQYIADLFKLMTEEERTIISESSFDNLWGYIWCNQHQSKQTQEYLECKRKFETLKEGYLHNGLHINLAHIIQTTQAKYDEPEWGFPKGRRRIREQDLECAKREFCEETGCIQTDFHIINSNPYKETFLGTNKVPYSHVYYLANMRENPAKEPCVDPTNRDQVREVRNVAWFHCSQVLERIREHNWERRDIFLLAHKKVLDIHNKQQFNFHGYSNQPPNQRTSNINLAIAKHLQIPVPATAIIEYKPWKWPTNQSMRSFEYPYIPEPSNIYLGYPT